MPKTFDDEGNVVFKTMCDEDCVHLGKFRDCLSESVYDAYFEWNYSEEEGGDATEGPGYWALLTDMRDVDFPHSAYILEIRNSGAVWVEEFDGNEEAREFWAEHIQPTLDEWYAAQEEVV